MTGPTDRPNTKPARGADPGIGTVAPNPRPGRPARVGRPPGGRRLRVAFYSRAASHPARPQDVREQEARINALLRAHPEWRPVTCHDDHTRRDHTGPDAGSQAGECA